MSEIRVDSIKAEDGISSPTFPSGIQVTGVVTATVLDATVPFLTVGSNAQLGNAGIITATGANISGNISAVDGSFSGNVSIAKTLTYEDVTNIDSVGLITARAGIKMTGGSLYVGGNSNFTGTLTGTATTATTVTVVNDGSDAETFVTFTNSATGNQNFKTNTSLKFNASNGTLTSTSFAGSGSGLTGIPAANLTGTLPAIDGSNLTGIDASAITTGTTKVQTAATSIVNQISGAGIATITAQGLNVTGIVTATSMTVFANGIDYQWQGGTATAWWKSEDIVSETSWPAAKGGTDANFINGLGGSNGISYIASDSLFNNHKSVSMSSGGSGSLRTSNEDQNRWWNNNDAFTMIMALQKDGHHSGTSLGDSAFAINYNVASAGSNVGGWGFCPFGDHTWGGQYGEMFGYTGSQFENQFMMFSYPYRGLFMIRMAANFDYGELSVNAGHGWHPLEMRHGGPSSLPGSNYRSISILNNSSENSSSHNFEGRVAECAWYKGKRLGGSELDTITKHWCNKFNL